MSSFFAVCSRRVSSLTSIFLHPPLSFLTNPGLSPDRKLDQIRSNIGPWQAEVLKVLEVLEVSLDLGKLRRRVKYLPTPSSSLFFLSFRYPGKLGAAQTMGIGGFFSAHAIMGGAQAK